MITCGIYITNCSVEPFIPKRKKQLFICTWHGGGAYKKLSSFYKKRKSFKIMSETRAKMTDYYTSACFSFTKFLAPDWYADTNKFLESGMPRNDILIHEYKNENLISSLKQKMGIPQDKKTILYAPTMRGWAVHPDSFDMTINVEKIIAALEKRFNGNFIFLFRCHHTMLGRINVDENVLDMSMYTDMQELLLVTDVLITDYSSSIWDFSLMLKPCFLFTPDLDNYESYQSFYVPIKEWPFSYAKNNDDLCNEIEMFNEEVYVKKVFSHHKELGSFEKGSATEIVCQKILEHEGVL